MDEPTLPSRRVTNTSVAIDPVALVVTECITVTSAMRKHARWAHSSISSILGSSTTARLPPAPARATNHDRYRPTSKNDLNDDDGPLPSRWGLRGKKGQSLQDNPLMSAFAKLRADLKGCKDMQTFETPALLQPFLQVIRSSSTTAPITSLALIAITKMLAYDIVNAASPGFAYGMQLLASTVTHCRFEGDNSPSDEVVFLRILKLMEDMICGSSGDVLGDQSVCEMMECALSICCHLRMSEVLRRSAEISMVTMCQVIFGRLKTLETEFEQGGGEDMGEMDKGVSKEDMAAAKIDSSANADISPEKMQKVRHTSLEVPGQSTPNRQSLDVNGSQLDLSKPTANTAEVDEEDREVRPYGLPSIRELFRVLSDLLDPHDRTRNDALRVMALRIVNVALEVAGPSIATHPSLASLAKDTLCRNLFQLVRSENIAILHESLRVAGTLLATCRSVLKLQQELFLSYVVACLHPRVPVPDDPGIDTSLIQGVPQAPALVKPSPAPSGTQSGRSTPVPVRDRQKLGMEGGSRKPDAREAMVESVGGLVRIPSFMVELFVNYDCEIDRSDLCTDMVGLLSRNSFIDAATWSTTNVPPLCLDSLLGYVQWVADRLDEEPTARDRLPDVEALRAQRAKKRVIIKGVSKFNESPKGGIAYLASQGIISDPNDPHAVTAFLKGTTRIDKKVLGDFISKKSNDAILTAFMDQFDFRELRVDEALRQVLSTFRLPGESQLIERIVTVFAEKYHASAETEEVLDKDGLFVLTYAIIMLNTELYNPNVKNTSRMSSTDFARNLRGVNGGKDFDPDYLQAIYDAIKEREIVLPEEHDNKHAFEHAWKELLVKVQSAENLVVCEGTNIFDRDMFAATWRPVIATLNYVFVSATEDAVFQRVIAGYNQCAQVAARYEIHDCLDQIIYSLAKISGLATEKPPSTSLNTEVQAQGKSIMVSKFAVDFGRDNKAELATLVLFRIINGHEGAIREGWTHIVRIIINLFVNSLIPTSFTSISRDLDLPPIPLQSPAQVVERNDKSGDVGLFSAFTSYVSSVMNDEPPEPNDQEIEATLTTVDCITACRFEEILGNVSELPVDSLKSLTLSLLAHLPESDSPRVITVKPEIAAPTPVRANGVKSPGAEQPSYDPAVVYVLELATILALRDEETIVALGAEVSKALETVIGDAERLHPVALSRTVFYLLSLLRASNDHGYIRAPVVLHAISSFRENLLKQCALPILKGIYSCVSGPAELKNEMATSPDFWSVTHNLQPVADAAPLVFQIVEQVVGANSETSAITADNYEAAVSLLNAFSTTGSVGAKEEQRQQQGPPLSGRRGGGAQKPSTPTPDQEPAKKPKRHADVVRATQALTLVSPQLSGRVPDLIKQSRHESPSAAWRAYWSPIFRCLGTQSINPCREVRHQALTSLQRCLLSPDLATSGSEQKERTKVFSEVLFPLIQQLLKPEVFGSDPIGMGETRVQAAQVVIKVFLQYLPLLSEGDVLGEVWISVLECMERLLQASASGGGRSGEMLREAVPEGLKNVLLVMSSGDYLAPPKEGDDEDDAELWQETWQRLNRFLPGLMPELFPEEAQAKAPKPKRSEDGTGATAAARDTTAGSTTSPLPERPQLQAKEAEVES